MCPLPKPHPRQDIKWECTFNTPCASNALTIERKMQQYSRYIEQRPNTVSCLPVLTEDPLPVCDSMQLSAIVVRLCYNCLFIWYWSLDWGKLQHQPVRSLSAVFMSRHISTGPRTAYWCGRKDLKKWHFKAGVLLVLNLYSSGLYLLVLISCIIDDDDDMMMTMLLLMMIIVITTTITLFSWTVSLVQITDLRHFRRRLRLVSEDVLGTG